MPVKFDYQGLSQAFEADWPVHVQVPQDGGTTEEQVFEARFRLYEEPEVAEGETPPPPPEDAEFLRTVFVGLAGPDAPTGPDFERVRELMLRRTYVRLAIFRAYNRFQAGAPAKN